MKLQKPKGTNDILPTESNKWQFIEETANLVFSSYNYKEIRTPIFEHYEVFSRSVGDTSDIVTKEMYDFYDKGERHITLRPEGTAPVVRSYVENKMFAPEVQKPVKLYYTEPMFRYERPQAGRMRQFHQIGVECFGSKNPATDVETIAMAQAFFEQLGIEGVSLHLNSLGDKESRAAYRQALVDYLTPYAEELSDDSKRRLTENPLRILDSKDKRDKEIVLEAPKVLDYLTEASLDHFNQVRSMLDALNIEYTIDHNMVRGLDYYNDTIFEFMIDVKGSELTICAGGRYDGLVEYFGGPFTPGFGFGMGIERLLLVMEEQGIEIPTANSLDVYVVVLGDEANYPALKVVQSLREQGFVADRDYLGRKIKAQFKSAEAYDAKLIITLGEEEVTTGNIIVKNNENRREVTTTLENVYEDFNPIFDELLEEIL
ncbi:histidine--tRNA ligase [Floricoccus tropicus]|uniref:Histidine--tRNA ligase n=1 Tax=Floricoccus tropicus TaxID=1859473 RepID=A0A1E8GLD4_9LACT|nr:histidine--tRNA ligase [Floricoccus tropicus]OFI48473.1 histidine--tRNA ligase [Floricoccus tropicus]